MNANLRKNIEIGVLFGLICAVVLSFSRFEVRCDELRKNILRLHIIANSDTTEDQTLKLAVRDAILENSTDVFKNCDNITSACKIAEAQQDNISTIANRVIKEKGFGYSAKVSVADEYFDTRVYDDFTLPAGTYKSLIVNLGKADGKNWWCVVFPCVCVPTADASLSNSVSGAAADTAENASKYEIKFKSAEIYEEFKKIFAKKR